MLPLFALVLPILLGIGALILEGGSQYIRQAQLQYLARGVGQSVLAQVGFEIVAFAESRYIDQCLAPVRPLI